jgi:hypothetical protein
MGNRATIEVSNDISSAAASIYLHWDGDPKDVIKAVKAAAPRMRKSDANYAMARLIGYYHNLIDGGLSLGLINTDDAHNWMTDNGHFVVNMAQGTIEQEGQTLADGIEFGEF